MHRKRTVNNLAHTKVFLIGNEHAAVRVDANAHRKAKIRRVRCAVRKVLAARAGQRGHHTCEVGGGVYQTSDIVSRIRNNVRKQAQLSRVASESRRKGSACPCIPVRRSIWRILCEPESAMSSVCLSRIESCRGLQNDAAAPTPSA